MLKTGRREYHSVGGHSEILSERSRQPGHDQTFHESESRFERTARACIEGTDYFIEVQPRELKGLFTPSNSTGNLGLIPEAKIQSVKTGKRFFIEVKKQGDQGNAEERAMKHHTVQFYKTLRDRFGYDYHPYVTVFCEALAVNPRYTEKFKYLIEPSQYFLWVNYDQLQLSQFILERCRTWLD